MEDSENEKENGEGGVQGGEGDTNAQWDGEFSEEMTQTTVQDVNQEIHSFQLEEQEEPIAEHPLKTPIFE